jgi:hypothetical protein
MMSQLQEESAEVEPLEAEAKEKETGTPTADSCSSQQQANTACTHSDENPPDKIDIHDFPARGRF